MTKDSGLGWARTSRTRDFGLGLVKNIHLYVKHFNKLLMFVSKNKTSLRVNKVKPKVWFKSSYKFDYGTAVGIRAWESFLDRNSL